MAKRASERALAGDYDDLHRLLELLERPYDEQDAEADARWAQLTPQWARGRPGITYMS